MKKIILFCVSVLFFLACNNVDLYADEEQDDERSFIFIGDSYQEGDIGEKRVFSWLDYLLLNHGHEMKNVYRNEEGGYGFAKSKKKYIDLLGEVDEIVDNKEEITDVVTVCGYNDFDYIDDVYREMKIYVNHIKKNYPNAVIWILPVEWTTNDNIDLVEELHKEIKKSAHRLNVRVCSDIEYTLKEDNISSDTVHPTKYGHRILATVIAGALELSGNNEIVGEIEDGFYPLERLKKKYLAYYRNGILDMDYFGAYEIDGKLYIIRFGVVDYDRNGVYKGTTDESNKERWLYVKNGVIDKHYTGFAWKDKNRVYFKDGHLDFLYTGFAQDGTDWYYVVRSKVDYEHTGLFKGTIDGVYGWWYVKDSKVYFTDICVKDNDVWWYVRNGCVDFGFSSANKWIINDEKVGFD